MRIVQVDQIGPVVVLDDVGVTVPELIKFATQHGAHVVDKEGRELYNVQFPGERPGQYQELGLDFKLSEKKVSA
jgi:hypothetical protein